ncbi:hypothetical protein [Humibacillus xanthopallidus]|uniref:Transcriptional regulator, AbiEi antitoxin, Type IV TA system n=1 Tax=Humibacillus xanthopallidus TaxID=412689 RepID=A0A543I0B2_9MICO|nr:hypothetical protein [Humibacillus xanthopallidus]TQM64028.1 hypothetical protein FBY41_0386 [Humibacillus xanthopallidus]
MDLPITPFSVAHGRELGMTDRQLDSATLNRPFRGVRSISAPSSLIERAEALACVLPVGAAFSHTTSAQLQGLPLSYALEADERLHVIHRIDRPHLRRANVVGHRAVHARAVTTVHGLRVVGLADTWVDLGELVGRGKPLGLDDAIVVGDACATALRSTAPLKAALSRRVRPRGKALLTEALELIRVGSWSPRETTARIMFVRAGLPEPLPNQAIFASWNPEVLLGYGDLVWQIDLPDGRKVRLIGEYQGAEFHSGDLQQTHDDFRCTRLEDDGWIVIEIWAVDMATASARWAIIRRFAQELHVPESALTLHGTDPRFFSRHAIDAAIARDELWRARRA